MPECRLKGQAARVSSRKGRCGVIQFSCPGCGKAFRVDDSSAGKHAKCRACGQRMQVPAAEPPPLPAVIEEPVLAEVVPATPEPQVYSGPSRFAAVGNTEAICPYCGKQLDKKPGRKKKCPHCANFMYVRTRPLDNQKVLVTEEQKEVIEEQWSIANGTHEIFLAERCAREEKKGRLASRFGREPSEEEIRRALLADKTTESNLRVLREVKRLQRESPGGFGVEVVSVLSNTTCDFCANMDGKIIPADRCTPKTIPPWPQCTSEEGCRCTILTAMGLDMPKGWRPR